MEPYNVIASSHSLSYVYPIVNSWFKSDLERIRNLREDAENTISVYVRGYSAFLEDIRSFPRVTVLNLSLQPDVDYPTDNIAILVKIIETLPYVGRLELMGLPCRQECRELCKAIEKMPYQYLVVDLLCRNLSKIAVLTDTVRKMRSLRSLKFTSCPSDMDSTPLILVLRELPLLKYLYLDAQLDTDSLSILSGMIREGKFSGLTISVRDHKSNEFIHLLESLKGSGIKKFHLLAKSVVQTSQYEEQVAKLLSACSTLMDIAFPFNNYNSFAEVLKNNYSVTNYDSMSDCVEGYRQLAKILRRNRTICRRWSPENHLLLDSDLRTCIETVVHLSYYSPILIDVPREIFQIIFSCLL